MKIAVTSQGKDLSSALDPRFGRSQFFIVFDTETDSFEAVDNSQNLNAAQGAGIQAGQNIANFGAGAVITGNVGPNAFRTLSAAGIKIYLCREGTVQQALDQYKAGNLQESGQSNVQGHWM